MVREMVKKLTRQDAGEEGEGVAQILDPGRFDIGEDEVAHAQLHGAYAILVGRLRLPHVLKAVQFRCAGAGSCECGDGRFVISSRVAHEVEGYIPVVGLVDAAREDNGGGATGVLPS